MATITLKYTDSGTLYERDFDTLKVVGFDAPDRFKIVGVQHEHLNGSITEEIQGIQRIVDVDFGVVQDRDERNFLLEYVKSVTREAVYAGVTMVAVLPEPRMISNTWLGNFQQSKRYILTFIDASVITTFGRQVQEGELAYIKRHVQITGTLDSPETLTTNSGKLATDQTGAAYPTFSDSTHVYSVIVDGSPYQEAKIVLVTQPSLSAGNMTFQVGVGYGGNASGDGNYYADIIIILQAK